MRYVRVMVHQRPDQFVEATQAPEIEALLSMSQSLSIVDRLMAMPRAEPAAGNAWDRAVSTRLQAKVTEMMRDCLENRHAA